MQVTTTYLLNILYVQTIQFFIQKFVHKLKLLKSHRVIERRRNVSPGRIVDNTVISRAVIALRVKNSKLAFYLRQCKVSFSSKFYNQLERLKKVLWLLFCLYLHER